MEGESTQTDDDGGVQHEAGEVERDQNIRAGTSSGGSNLAS
jgi:hypothetical protein